MSPLASVLIARYLVARGRRDAAIAELSDRSEPWHSPETVFVELDRLEAVDALGTLARDAKLAWYYVEPLARALARRRRFDLLRPLLEREHEKPVYVGPTIYGALAGLWSAPAVADDSVLVRDWLLPITTAAPHARGACAQLLGLLGDVEMAGAIADEQRAAIAACTEEIARVELLVAAAPTAAALGSHESAAALLREAFELWDKQFDEDIDGYGQPLHDSIDYARATVSHIKALAYDRTLPWRPQSPVSNTFTGFMAYGRYGANREQHEEWGHAIQYRIEARDIPALFTIFEHARTTDLDHAPLLLVDLAERLPRAWIDRDLAMALSGAACSLTDPQRQDGGIAVMSALAEAGHLAAARALLPHVESIYIRPGAYARLGAHLVPHDPAAARGFIDTALGGYGAEQELAQYVDADLRAGR